MTSNVSTDSMLEESPDFVSKLPEAEAANQIITVAAWQGVTAWIALHEKNEDGVWQVRMTSPGFVGFNGIGKTVEGDMKSPKGTFHLKGAFGLADDPGCGLPYTKCDEDYYWSGDTREGMHFNELVSLKDFPDLDTEKSEHISTYTRQYQYCLSIDYNSEGDPSKGYAIFFHCFGPKCPFTEGCISLPEAQMKCLLERVSPDCVVVINSMDYFEKM